MDYRTQQQIDEIVNLGISLLVMGFTFAVVKELVLDQETEYWPQTVTVECPMCHKQIAVPQHNAITRSEALRQHIKQEHISTVGRHPQELPTHTKPCPKCGRPLHLRYISKAQGYWWVHEYPMGAIWSDKTVCDYSETDFSKEWQPQALLIEGGDPVPPHYRDLISWVSEPLPEYSLMIFPAVEVEAGERKIDAVMKQLKDGVENIQQSENFRLFLTTMSKFHDYSIGNLILIGIQKPNATRVAGFMTWKELGRWVKMGEKGIAILAPVMPPRPTCPTCGTKIPKGAKYCPQCGQLVEIEPIEITPRRYRVVYVFDISQTEGRELPEFKIPVLSGEANEELFAKLLALMKQRSVQVSFESRPYLSAETKGQFRPPHHIWIRPEEPPAQQLKTLLHEIAHYYSEGVFKIPTQDAETIAESAAYVVGAHYGFDTGARSFPYVALWAQDKKVLEQNLNAVRRVATTMLESLEKLEKVELLTATIPGDDLNRIADKYGWWAARLAEAICPHNDVACVEREAKRLAEARRARVQ